MSVWTTKTTGRAVDYIVLKHTLKGVNYVINGIRFRDGYAVVEKGSKTHHTLKQIPVLKSAQEYPITFLRKLSFITRPSDVKMVYGVDVYAFYLRQLEKELAKEKAETKAAQEVIHVTEEKKCGYKIEMTRQDGKSDELCRESALEESPSGYCFRHILNDPKLKELGIEVPQFIPKKDKKKVRDDVIDTLKKLKKEGK